MNQKEAVHERLKEYACVAPDQMMQKLQINAEGITQEEAIIRRQKYGNSAPSAKNKDCLLYTSWKEVFLITYSVFCLDRTKRQWYSTRGNPSKTIGIGK